MYFCYLLLFFCYSFSWANNYKSLNYEIPMRKNLEPPNAKEKKIWTHEIPTSKVLWPQKIHEKKFWTPEIPISKILDPRITYFWTLLKFWTQEIPTRKNFGPMKNPRRHNDTMELEPRVLRWYVNHQFLQTCVKHMHF